MHLDDSTLDLYLTPVLDRDELRAFDRHVMTCLPCLLLLEFAGLDRAVGSAGACSVDSRA